MSDESKSPRPEEPEWTDFPLPAWLDDWSREHREATEFLMIPLALLVICVPMLVGAMLGQWVMYLLYGYEAFVYIAVLSLKPRKFLRPFLAVSAVVAVLMVVAVCTTVNNSHGGPSPGATAEPPPSDHSPPGFPPPAGNPPGFPPEPPPSRHVGPPGSPQTAPPIDK